MEISVIQWHVLTLYWLAYTFLQSKSRAMEIRMNHRTANPYESLFSYSRATRRGPFIYISGTTSIDPASGQLLHPESAYKQALAIFAEIVRAVEAVGGRKEDIVRVRMFVTANEDTQAVGQALKESLGDIQPAATMIVGPRSVMPEMRVEIEADGIVLQ